MTAVSGDGSAESVAGLIFDVQRFAVHDGPGIRTLVFFKGCPLRCAWCSNPESQREAPELLHDAAACLQCGRCAEVCATGGLGDRERCEACGRCADVCCSGARRLSGRRVAAGALVAELLRDAPFFRNSGGGVTLGGGEPLAQPEFAAAILRLLRARGIHTAVETCGHAPWESFERVRPWTQLFLFDLKHVDVARHRQLTGGDLPLILENLDRLARDAAVVVRVPVVPGVNDDPATVAAVARQAAAAGAQGLQMLPYHRLGQGKYRLLGRPYTFPAAGTVPEERLASLLVAAERAGIAASIEGRATSPPSPRGGDTGPLPHSLAMHKEEHDG